MKFVAEHWPGWSDGANWVVVDKTLEPCEAKDVEDALAGRGCKRLGMIASGFMTEAEVLDYIARYGSREHLIETERSKMKETAYRALNYGEKPRERPN
jgi:hypothetical protein